VSKEREHCEAAARTELRAQVECDYCGFSALSRKQLADLIQRERQDARDAALEEVARVECMYCADSVPMADGTWHRDKYGNHCACRAKRIRALKEKP
jgi:hypothetical protein